MSKRDSFEVENVENAKKLKINEDKNEFEFEGEEAILNEDDQNDVCESNNFEQLSQSFGLRERINKHNKRFFGLIKQSPADFIVNEINLNGDIVYLNNFDLPVNELEKNYQNSDNNELDDKLKNVIGENHFEQLKEFLQSEIKETAFKIEAPQNKDDRKMIHDYIKMKFKNFNSNTTSEKNIQYIEICHNKFKRSSMKDCYKNNDNRNQMNNFKYCECALYKENIDTIQAVNLIVKHLRINVKRVGYAGTKDKKAKTTQLLSFFKIDPSQLSKLNTHFHNVKLGNFALRNGENLKLGDLSGNHFKLVIREVNELNEQTISQTIESFKNNGFINYFGLQRFGNSIEAPTHHVGKFLIQNNLREAIDLILKPRSNKLEKSEIKKARDAWVTSGNDARKALFHVERINCIEKYLLVGLSRSDKNDYLGAFQFIPRNMRLMYLHAYQSYIWNEAVSKRLSLFGLKPCIGDIVIKRSVIKTRSEDKKVVLLDETNINEFDIYDVVLPLPGHDIVYPRNELKDFYVEILDRDGIKLESFKNKIKDFSLSGDYRHIVIKPSRVDYKIVDYSDKSVELSKSDWDLIKEKEDCERENDQINETRESSFRAVLIEYSLPSSSYATVALREIMDDSSKL